MKPVVGVDVTVHTGLDEGSLWLFEEEEVWLKRSMKGQRAKKESLSWFLFLFLFVIVVGFGEDDESSLKYRHRVFTMHQAYLKLFSARLGHCSKAVFALGIRDTAVSKS